MLNMNFISEYYNKRNIQIYKFANSNQFLLEPTVYSLQYIKCILMFQRKWKIINTVKRENKKIKFVRLQNFKLCIKQIIH